MEEQITRRIEAWRDALIDLSRRNPLLTLPKSVLPVTASPDGLWRLPSVGKRGAYRFLPAAPAAPPALVLPGDEDEASEAESETPVAPVIPQSGGRRQQFVSADELKRLDNLLRKARLSLNEQGINVLFVTLGILEWPDPKLGSLLRSPILLLPVALTKALDNSGFSLSRFEDDAAVNPTLRYRLSQSDVRWELPDLTAEEDTTPETFLQELASRVSSRPGWRILPDECFLGRFSYLRLAMYEDLSRQAEAARQKPIIRALAGDTAALTALRTVSSLAEMEGIAAQKTHYVLPADPSQQAAILAARQGQSFVLQGPPGTGKTQTIANLIAACIADGRKVLFVSEKMAALEAVYKRLQEKRLGNFCLEAHSHKANKKDILEQLRAASAPASREADGEPDYAVLEALREDLNQHAEALHTAWSPLYKSVYEVRGLLAEVRNAPDLPFVFARPEIVSGEDLHHLEALVERLGGYSDLFSRGDDHPWRTLQQMRFSTELQTRLRAVLETLLRQSDNAPVLVRELQRLCGIDTSSDETLSPEDAETAILLARLLEETPRPLREWIEAPDEAVQELRTVALSAQKCFLQYQEQRADLLTRWSEALFTLPHRDLSERLTTRHQALLTPALGNNWADRAREEGDTDEKSLSDLAQKADDLQRVGERLCRMCGFPPAETLSAHGFWDEVVALALTVFPARLAWYEAGEIARLSEWARTVEQKQDVVSRLRTELDSVYSPGLSNLDLDGLQSRFANDYANFLRLFKSAYWQDKRTVNAALLPGKTLAGRDIPADVVNAILRRDTERWIAEQTPGLNEAFGQYYRGYDTDWAALSAALVQTDKLIRTLGTVPAALRDILIAGSAQRNSLREQYDLFTLRRRACEAAVTAVNTRMRLLEAEMTPVTQLLLPSLKTWSEQMAAALRDVRGARDELRTIRSDAWTVPARELIADLNAAAKSVETVTAIQAEGETLTARYSQFFAGLKTDWQTILSALEWTDRFHKFFAGLHLPLPPATVSLAVMGERETLMAIGRARSAVEKSERDFGQIWQEILALFRPELLRSADFTRPLQRAIYTEQQEFAGERLTVLGELERWLGFQQLRLDCADAGLLSFYEVTTRQKLPWDSVLPAFRKGFYQRWLDAVTSASPILQSFRGDLQDSRRSRLTVQENALLQANPKRIRGLARERRDLTRMIDVGEVGVLKRLLNMQRPRDSVRKILANLPTLLFRLTPCLMMSPLSVSLFLDPDRIWFDLVIFDEASQVFMESALGALLRADQAVIAGDTRQLPPTSFFKGMQDDGDGDDDENGAGNANEFESVLSAASAIAADADHFPERELTWHYRSRHESLIGFSRRHFYEKLDTFPSSSRPSALHFEFVADGVYYGGAGKSRTNPMEAARVAELVVAQLQAEPEQTVGVITMSEAQQNAILAEIDRRRAKADPALLPLLSEDPTAERPEPFFVKNIENVQGDERDVIFLSVGYGRYPDRTLYQRFGPLNSEGGEKRLNVAVTRARRKCVTVASIQPEEIIVREETRPGPRLLREYLEEARAASPVGSAFTDNKEAINRDGIVETVARALRTRGHTIHQGIGLFDYQIDIGILDPANPDRYLLGIECDGRGYVSEHNAYAREALRPQVLRGLGWHLFRVWSAEWVRDPDAVLEAIEAAIQKAIRGEAEVILPLTLPEPPVSEPEPTSEQNEEEDEDESPLPNPPPQAIERRTGLLPGLSYFEPYSLPPLPGGTATIYGESNSEIQARRAFFEEIILAEGPVHRDTIPSYLARAAQLNRAGSRIQESAWRTIDLLVQDGVIEKRIEGEEVYLWPPRSPEIPARVPRPGEPPRPIKQISRAEIGQIMCVLLRNAIGMRQEEAILETARLLGYEHLGTNVREKVEMALADLEYENRVHIRGGQVYTLEVE